MEYTKLGNTGMDVSRICLGCMSFGDGERWVHKWVLNEESAERTNRAETNEVAKWKYDATAETDRQVVERVVEIAEKHGVARAYRACVAVTEAAGNGADHRGDQDLPSGRCRRRSGRETDPGRDNLPRRAVCAASHRGSSVNLQLSASVLPYTIVRGPAGSTTMAPPALAYAAGRYRQASDSSDGVVAAEPDRRGTGLKRC
jgi:hypothetical protein